MYIPCPDVKVGIGTDAPTHGLHVTTDAKINSTLFVGYSLGIGTEADNFARLTIKNTNHAASLFIKQMNTGQYTKLMYMEYIEPTTEVLKVTNVSTGQTPYLFEASGKMTVNNGIGNIFQLSSDGRFTLGNGTDKLLQLDADGLLHARKIKVDTQIWPDFVFEEEYKLMPLLEVDQYVKKEKHLPNVPSQLQVESEGIDVSEMNVLLMQKLEELTLYTIDQEKRIIELQESMKQLQESLNSK